MRPFITTILACSAFALAACSDKPGTTSAGDPPATPTGPAPRGGMVMNNVIVIANSGSTNTIGYRILVTAAGGASFVSGDGSGNAMLPSDVFARLKADADAAMPLSQIPAATDCVKPASLGTKTSIALGGERSPDLSCSQDPKAQKLLDDIADVAEFLGVRNTPRSEGKELPPQNF